MQFYRYVAYGTQIIFNFVVVVVVVLLSNLYKIAIFKNIQLPVHLYFLLTNHRLSFCTALISSLAGHIRFESISSV